MFRLFRDPSLLNEDRLDDGAGSMDDLRLPDAGECPFVDPPRELSSGVPDRLEIELMLKVESWRCRALCGTGGARRES